ncbi:MAG: type II toxin-antitoxin system VapC family toxin [Steroidobacteraceae bacterium]
MRKYLLDSSFFIDLLNEMADGVEGPAFHWLKSNGTAQLWISPVTVAEVLEGAVDTKAVKAYLARYSWQGIHRVHAESVALRQKRTSRRMGENDAWQLAIAERMSAAIVGHDPAAFGRLGPRYVDHRRSQEPP